MALCQFLENEFSSVVLCQLAPTTELTIPYTLETFIILATLPYNLMQLRRKKRKITELPGERNHRLKLAVMLYEQGRVLWKRQENETG